MRFFWRKTTAEPKVEPALYTRSGNFAFIATPLTTSQIVAALSPFLRTASVANFAQVSPSRHWLNWLFMVLALRW